MDEQTLTSHEVPVEELGDRLCAVRVYTPVALQRMRRWLAQQGQLTPVAAYRREGRLEVFDGLKRLRAARDLSWARVRVEEHALDGAGAKVRLLACNAASGLSGLEEAWVVRALYREDKLGQAQIAQLLGHDKSWVSRKVTLAEGLADEVLASVRLGLLSVTAAMEVARLQRCNQERVAQVVARRGLTTRQTGRLVDALLPRPEAEWEPLLEEHERTAEARGAKRTARTPGEQIVADAAALKKLAVRLETRLLERSLESLGADACAPAVRGLEELRAALEALGAVMRTRLEAGVRR